MPHFIEIGTREDCLCMHLSYDAKKKRKSDEVHELVSQELLGLLISNLVCKVRYMKALKL